MIQHKVRFKIHWAINCKSSAIWPLGSCSRCSVLDVRDPAKKEFGEQLLSHVDTFTKELYLSLKGDTVQQASPTFEFLENALGKFDDGPFLLGQFSLVDVAYIPFVERFHIVLAEVFKHDITEGRPKLATWIEELNKIDAYTQTRVNPQEIVELFKNPSTVKVGLQQSSFEIFQ
ncbi:glutathione S-transferase l3-like protein [Trifolium pratense]|uniref:Glutathione S-transferase l3-like protein n=1 Tax=Trifolium pratense TaxID=57577 RepID=A0A2K3LQX2_TRIPR|nr:glutathione S-transferase l3-like protein [Trifolium pratense]